MIVLTQLIYVRPGEESAFHAFEDVVLPLVPAYGGELLLRLRPPPESCLAGSLDAPYEVHLLRFPTEDDLRRFAADPTRQQALHLKDRSVRSALLYNGREV